MIRRKYLIDKNFQLKYVFYVVLSLVGSTVVISLIVYLTTWFSVIKEFSSVKLHQDLSNIVRMREYEGVRTFSNVETIPILKEEAKMLSNHQIKVVNKILKNTNKRVIVAVIIILVIIIIFGIFISHRIAGPLFRMNRELDKLIKGNFDVNFTLRKKDELKPIAEKLQVLTQKLKDFNQLIKKLENTNLTNEQKEIIEKISALFKSND